MIRDLLPFVIFPGALTLLTCYALLARRIVKGTPPQ